MSLFLNILLLFPLVHVILLNEMRHGPSLTWQIILLLGLCESLVNLELNTFCFLGIELSKTMSFLSLTGQGHFIPLNSWRLLCTFIPLERN